MQHLDDALIAEWVDGAVDEDSPRHEAIAAHVAECDACRARVEEERALADHVHRLLGTAAPPERVPPFEEVLHRARRPGRAGLPLAWRRLAWAATVVVAGGVGWYARGALLEGPSEPARTAYRAAPVEPGDASVPTAGQPDTPAPAPAQAAADLRTDRSDAPPATDGRAQEAEQAADAVTTEAVANERGETAAVGPVRQNAPALAAREERAGRGVAPAPSVAVAAVAEKSAVAGWQLVTPEFAAAILGRPPLTVAGLRVVRLERAVSHAAIRITQDLGDGTLLALVESAAAADEGAGAAEDSAGAGPGSTTATVTRDGLRITGTAPVSPDSLQVLLGKVR